MDRKSYHKISRGGPLRPPKRKPYLWVSSLYYMQGLPFAVVSFVTVVMYQNFGIANAHIALFASLLLLPWSLKPIWSSVLENYLTKRKLTLMIECLLVIMFLLIACVTSLPNYFALSFIIFALFAFVAASHDITSDGVYLAALNAKQQIWYVGYRTFFYQLARFSCQGGLLIFAGFLMRYYSVQHAWQLAFIVLAIVTFVIVCWQYFLLPEVEHTKHQATMTLWKKTTDVWARFFRQSKLVSFLLFLLLFNFAEAQLIKINPLFLLDTANNGGVNLSTAQVGFLVGLFGTAVLMLGVLCSSWLINRYLIKKSLPWLALLTVVCNIGYWVLAKSPQQHLVIVYLIIAVGQFGFGLSNGGYMSYILQKTTVAKYAMSYYALATAIMALGFAGAGAISGYIQQLLGYRHFFIWILIAGLLVWILTWVTIKYDDTLSTQSENAKNDHA